MKKLFKKLLAVALVGAMVGFVGCKDYDDDINALNDRIDGIENNQIKTINEQIASMQSSVSSLQSAQAATQATVEALQATVAALQNKHDADIAAVQADITALEAEIAALKAKDAELAEAIAAIEKAMEDMATKSWVEATLEAYATQEMVSEKISEIWSTLTPATIRIANLESQMTENQILDDAQQEAIDAANVAIAQLEKDLDAAIEDLKAWVEYEVLGAYVSQEFFYNYLTNWVYGYYENGDAYMGELTFASIEEQLEALKELVGDISVADAIKAAIEENNGYLQAKFVEQMKPIQEAVAALKGDVKALKGALVIAQANIEGLINRIQSIVYVPDYADHKATVPALIALNGVENDVPAEGDIVETRSAEEAWSVIGEGEVAMTFQVTPAALATKIVALELDAFNLAFEEVIATRSAEYGLEILEVVPAAKAGQFTVIAQPTLPKEFYYRALEALAADDYETWGPYWYDEESWEAARSFSVALQLQATHEVNGETATQPNPTTGSNVMSNYVNLFPVADVVDALVMINEEDEVLLPGEAVEYEIEYDAVDEKIVLLEGYELGVLIGEEAYLISELPYVLPEAVAVCEGQAFLKNNDACEEYAEANFAVEDTEEACDEVVSLVEADKNSVGNYLITNHTYTVGAMSAEFFTQVDIIKAYKTVVFEDWTYIWWYADYVKATEAGVEYEGSKLTVKLKADESNLPADVKPEDVVKYWTSKPVTVTVDGEESEMTVTPVDYADGIYVLEVTGWEFAEGAQEIEATCEFATIDIKFVINATFVNLPEEITAEVADDKVTYDNTLEVFKTEGQTYLIEQLYPQVKQHFSTPEEFASSLAIDASKVHYEATRGEDVVTDTNRGFLNSSFSATMLRVKNDGKLDGVMEVKKADVTAADDVFNFTTTIAPSYGDMKIVATGALTVAAPNYYVKHNDVWVAAGENGYYSNVKGLWAPDGKLKPINAFSTEEVELEEAFEIVKLVDGKEVAVSAEEIAAQGLVLDFKLEKNYGEGIVINEDNQLAYNGYVGTTAEENKVDVAGTLSVGAIEIPKAFLAYDNYVVYGYNPIADWEVAESEVISTETAKPDYTTNIISKLQLKDVRGKALIKTGATSIVDPWVDGDGKNGFVVGAQVENIFQLQPIEVTYVITEAATGFETDVLDGRVTVDTTTGEVKFDNLNNLALQKDLKLNVTAKVAYPWGEQEATVTYIITK